MAQKTVQAIRPPTRVDRHGRIVIPAEIRQELGLKPGVAVTFSVQDGGLKVMTVREAIKQVQERVHDRLGDTTGLLDEFLAERRREAENE